jgi:hypothetical protein
MGYETRLIVGKATDQKMPEFERDLTKPYDDGSGFEKKKDADGNDIPTGRTIQWFHNMAEVDLAKMGEGPLSDLHDRYVKFAKDAPAVAWEVYGFTDGNHAVTEDCYGDPLTPVPIAEVLAALKKENSIAGQNKYRRVLWAIALLEAMVDDPEGLSVLFYGH